MDIDRTGGTEPALLPLYFSVFVAVLGFSLVAPIFPIYVIDLGASYTMLGVIISIYGAVQLITQIPIGRFSDQVGRKPLIMLGLLTFTLMPPLYIYAKNVYLLLLIRIMGGIGASAVWPLAMALIVEQAHKTRRGSAMGGYNAAFYSAVAIGPVIGGGLYDLFGLSAPFYFWALLGLISIIMVMITVKEPTRHETLPKINLKSLRGPREKMILPGYDMTFVACCSMVVWTGIIGGFNITMLPTYASGLGMSTTEVGLLYMAYAGATSLSNVYFGKASDRGRRKLLMFSGSLIGVLSFIMLIKAGSLITALMAMGLIGLGLGLSNPAAAALIADTTCTSRRGETFGIFNTSRMTGVVIGPLIAGLTADAFGIYGVLLSFAVIAGIITLGTLMIRDPRLSPACTES